MIIYNDISMSEVKKIILLKAKENIELKDSATIINNDEIKPKMTLKSNTKASANVEIKGPLSAIELQYMKKKHRESILETPSMYVGSVKEQEEDMFIYDEDTKQIIKKKIKFRPGLYKLFDEGGVNMRDHVLRMLDKIQKQEKIIEGKLPPNPLIDVNRKYRPVKKIEFFIDVDNGTITLRNDGDSPDVAWHDSEKKYVPELIFGDLLSGTNFDKNQEKTWGGKHGYGAKLINVLSSEFIIEIVDSFRGLKYVQKFSDNMGTMEDPVITKCKSAAYTQITFKPDLRYFGLKSLRDDDTVALMRKRVIDIAACTPKEVIVWYNGTQVEVRNFERYVDLYIGARGQCKRLYTVVNDDWEIAVCASTDGNFEHVSLANGICTFRGGKYVDHAATIISGRLAKYALENKKGMANITAKNIKDNLWLFINCTVVNPDFDTQTKETMTTAVSEFRSKCDVSDDFIAKLAQGKLGILDKALKLSEFKAGKGLKKSDGKKTKRIKNEKAIDAHYAGNGKKAQQCTLILTEGDSAQTFAISGLGALSDEERKFYGVAPLKGKIINPKDQKITSIENNQQFIDIKILLGLKQGLDYTNSLSSLRYGSVMIITDADVDGDHIKGLVFNLFHEFWPSLLKCKGFFKSLLTPIVKVICEGVTYSLYSELEYVNWKLAHAGKKWDYKYYKGLGTHKPADARECFLSMKLQYYSWDDLSRMVEKAKELAEIAQTTSEKSVEENKDTQLQVLAGVDELNPTMKANVESYKTYYKGTKHPCDLALHLAFNKKLADNRKGWIVNYLMLKNKGLTDPDLHKLLTMSYYDFINEKLIDFSVYDNERSIPSMLDGLKPGQRKILYAVFKKKLKKTIKVAQLSGYVAEHTAYHHGEESLNKTIVGLSQDYAGSNNINLLEPEGQFGTRLMNGDDYASPRYIFTMLNPLTAVLFNKIDENLYDYLDDDGKLIEPKNYAPVLPMILINGADGIGTGWSTQIPTFNPHDVAANIKRYIMGEPFVDMIPWYRGFRGTVIKLSHQKYKITGVYNRTGPTTVEITEIPVGPKCKSFKDYKNFLEELLFDDSEQDEKKKTAQILEDIEILVSDETIKCLLTWPSAAKLDELYSDLDIFEKRLKLSAPLTTSNMHLFDANGVITKYDSPIDILEAFCEYRIGVYGDRKRYLITNMESDILKISEKVRFITYINDSNHPLKVQNKNKKFIAAKLEEYHFAKFSKKKIVKKVNMAAEDEIDEADDDENGLDTDDSNKNKSEGNHAYLLGMPIYSLSLEKLDELSAQKEKLLGELKDLKNTTVQEIWSDDVIQVEDKLLSYEKAWGIKYANVMGVTAGVLRLPNHLKTKLSLKINTGPKLSLKPKIKIDGPKLTLKTKIKLDDTSSTQLNDIITPLSPTDTQLTMNNQTLSPIKIELTDDNEQLSLITNINQPQSPTNTELSTIINILPNQIDNDKPKILINPNNKILLKRNKIE